MKSLSRPHRIKSNPPECPSFLRTLGAIEHWLAANQEKIKNLFQGKYSINRALDDMMEKVDEAALKVLIFPITAVEYCIDGVERLSPQLLNHIVQMMMNERDQHYTTINIQKHPIVMSIMNVIRSQRIALLQHLPLPFLVRQNGEMVIEYSDAIATLPESETDVPWNDLLPKDTIRGRDGKYYKLEVGEIGERMRRVLVTDDEQRLLQEDARQCFDRAHKKRSWLERGAQFLQEILE
jgi:hypothetical protein